MKQNPWRQRLLLLSAILIVFGFLTMPLGLLGLIFGLYCLWYGLQLKPESTSRPERARPRQTMSRPQSMPSTGVRPPLPEDRIAEYRSRIRELESLEHQADRRLAGMTEYLNQLFADSQITKDRYLDIVRKAEDITDVNLKKARTALAMFADGPVTPQRLEILDGYVQSSREMLAKIDGVVTELMRAEQSDQLRNTQHIEEAMNELKETARYYAQS
ncbi:hypothetical protein [Faecalibaculum rodentium]|uniref:5-bromo-4-chloroindolyl phosphate hydrolysis protein n=2 Tax=Faecalibaculum rodentium TaxID=1702221 RepID=A0A1Q9YLD3_9FIRM|nr:hypothetical protein [Faecalibaculum rodentium]OLU45714.1 hypothetical protein BO223_04280 [Faecalibaculum rodentium]